jgi:hypothetical protein
MPRAKTPAVQKDCLHCSAQFTTTDSRKVYCKKACKDAARNTLEGPTPEFSPAFDRLARRGMERRATQEWMYEEVFKTAPEYRADIVMAFLVYAAVARAKRYRDLLTYPTAQRSSRFTARDRGTVGLHFQGRPSAYPVTIASMANHVCRHHLGISSRQFIDEVKRDGVTMADMQDIHDALMDRSKPTPIIQGCNVEGPAYRQVERHPTVNQIAHAEMVLSDPLGAAKRCAIVAQAA